VPRVFHIKSSSEISQELFTSKAAQKSAKSFSHQKQLRNQPRVFHIKSSSEISQVTQPGTDHGDKKMATY
jgi:hypothetical protein